MMMLMINEAVSSSSSHPLDGFRGQDGRVMGKLKGSSTRREVEISRGALEAQEGSIIGPSSCFWG